MSRLGYLKYIDYTYGDINNTLFINILLINTDYPKIHITCHFIGISQSRRRQRKRTILKRLQTQTLKLFNLYQEFFLFDHLRVINNVITSSPNRRLVVIINIQYAHLNLSTIKSLLN